MDTRLIKWIHVWLSGEAWLIDWVDWEHYDIWLPEWRHVGYMFDQVERHVLAPPTCKMAGYDNYCVQPASTLTSLFRSILSLQCKKRSTLEFVYKKLDLAVYPLNQTCIHSIKRVSICPIYQWCTIVLILSLFTPGPP